MGEEDSSTTLDRFLDHHLPRLRSGRSWRGGFAFAKVLDGGMDATTTGMPSATNCSWLNTPARGGRQRRTDSATAHGAANIG